MTGEAGYADALALVHRLTALLDEVVVRGMRASGPDELSRLHQQRDALAQMGANHLTEALDELLADLRSGRREGARTLLKARASVRVFERLLSLRAVAEALSDGLQLSQEADDARD